MIDDLTELRSVIAEFAKAKGWSTAYSNRVLYGSCDLPKQMSEYIYKRTFIRARFYWPADAAAQMPSAVASVVLPLPAELAPPLAAACG